MAELGLPDHEWLGMCRRSAEGVLRLLAASAPGRGRLEETGQVGSGGDRTLVIDRDAEDVVLTELERLYDAGARFTVITEERGIVDFGGGDLLVIVDPIDGSLNAKRGLRHHALSIAVADGPTMADVAFGYVYDAGPREEWRARRGVGAWLDDAPLRDVPPERRRPDGRLEIVALEAARPRHLAASSAALEAHVHRVRAIGAVAIALCQVAAGRVDAMASLAPCRSVDAAAAQLVVRESGGLVAFTTCDEPLGAPLADLRALSPVVAARTARGLADVSALPVS